MRTWLIAAVLMCGLGAGRAQQATLAPGPSAKTADVKTTSGPAIGHPLDAADLEAFFDGIVPLQLERSDIAGASVLVMQDGNVLLQKGYGVADWKAKKPVDPVSTIFRLASISKLFTWTSIMQLAEQGKLNIDTDVNQYLDFQIQPKFGRPITLRNLMTHTGGFEETARDVILTDPKQRVTLRDYLIRNQPERIFPPGEVSAYSNYGVGLAGYIVQRVSGEPYEQYVAEHIFGPLKMVHSTFQQPPQPALEKLPSDGYRGDTTKKPVGFEIFNPAPAGGLSSTAADMGRFGQALLNGGTLEGAQILRPETLRLMWTPQFRASNQMPPICMGFYEDWRNNVHWIGHEGDLIAFHSLFFLQPERKLTLFVSYNSAGSARKARPEIIQMFTDRYFPGYTAPPVITETRPELKQIEGTYWPTRREDSNRGKLLALGSEFTASINKDGALELDGFKDLRGHTIQWKPIGKDLWQEVDGQQHIAAIRDSSGKVVRLATDFAGSQEQRVRWYDNLGLVGPLVGFSLLALGLVIGAAAWRLGQRIFLRRRPHPQPQPGTVWVPVMTKLAALLWVLPIVALMVIAIRFGDDALPPSDAWDKWFLLMNVVVGVAIALSLFPIVSGLRVWGRDLRWITKVKFTLVAFSALAMCWFAVHFHLIGTTRI